MSNIKNIKHNSNINIKNNEELYSQVYNSLQQPIDIQNKKIEYLQNLQNEINELTNKFN